MAAAIQNKIRIRLKAYDTGAIETAAKEIVETATRTGASVSGPVPLPTEKNVYCVIRSTFISPRPRPSTRCSAWTTCRRAWTSRLGSPAEGACGDGGDTCKEARHDPALSRGRDGGPPHRPGGRPLPGHSAARARARRLRGGPACLRRDG